MQLQVGDNIEVLYLVATSEFEKDSWLKALRQCTFVYMPCPYVLATSDGFVAPPISGSA